MSLQTSILTMILTMQISRNSAGMGSACQGGIACRGGDCMSGGGGGLWY